MTVDVSVPQTRAEAEDFLARIEQRAQRFETPCGDGTMVWHVWGQGRPVIFLHGSHGNWTHWVFNIDALARDCAMYVADLPGMGDSAMPAGEDHAAAVDAIATGIRQLLPDATPLDIVGFSFGGVLAAHLAARHPDLTRRLIVIDSGGIGTPIGPIDLRRIKGLEGVAWREALRHNMLQIMFHDPANADALATAIYEIGFEAARFNVGPLVMPDQLVSALERSNVPLDAIWADHDLAHPDPELQEAALRRYRPNMRFRLVTDSGHWCMYEQPDTFNETLRELLALG